MKIDEIKINGFGKLKEKEIELKDGINIVYGDNEAGKSTLLKFITSMFFGASKNKNGKSISDFDKFKPWDDTEFSGKLKYTLDDEKKYEIFREFKKKAPVIYNEFGEDITKEYGAGKSKEINFLENQIGVDENLFSKTAIIEQQEVKIEKNDTNIIVQKISNLVSTGDDNISFNKSLEKLTKMQNENIGTDRTKQRPMNIADENIKKLLEEKKKLNAYKENLTGHEKEKEIFSKKLEQLNSKKEKIKEKKNTTGDINFEKVNQKVNIYNYLLITFIIICVAIFAVVRNVVIDLVSVIPVIILFVLRKKKSSSELENLKKSNQELSLKYESQQESIQNEINEISLKLHMLENEKENMDEKLEELTRVEEKLEEEQNIKEELTSLNVSYELARECLESAYMQVKHNLSPKFEEKLCEIISNITDGKYKNIKLDDKNGLFVEIENGSYLPVERLSIGTIDEIYLSLRLSTLSEISNEKLPIILDETFAYFDNHRLTNILRYLQDTYYDNQIIIFSCSKREEEILKQLKIEYHLISLD